MSSHKIGDLLAKVKRPGKVPKSEYLEEGEFPVIDQGKLPIAGYTNNADVVLRSPLPITIFGEGIIYMTRVNQFSIFTL